VRQAIRQRRRERQIALTLEVPTVLFSDDLEALGRPIQVSGADTVQGIAVSPGVGEGPALVLREPRPPGTQQGYVLVCPSTDPAWVPLFLQASALVMETGGVLSHGAIVAREFGLPAVVGIPDACQRFRTGQRLRVNGNTGEVQLLEG
jgi:pyruvate,water dikinase